MAETNWPGKLLNMDTLGMLWPDPQFHDTYCARMKEPKRGSAHLSKSSEHHLDTNNLQTAAWWSCFDFTLAICCEALGGLPPLM